MDNLGVQDHLLFIENNFACSTPVSGSRFFITIAWLLARDLLILLRQSCAAAVSRCPEDCFTCDRFAICLAVLVRPLWTYLNPEQVLIAPVFPRMCNAYVLKATLDVRVPGLKHGGERHFYLRDNFLDQTISSSNVGTHASNRTVNC